ncbi:hypothetical protein COT72_03120 [archaeon CG10_big_fil_rev_8_21_14_0_10_43_11]|nr:MAG: hypothetical protein COT72_03120 [archaeon CG10_big_fil_rev_8_21_14_0_10_43_11]
MNRKGVEGLGFSFLIFLFLGAIGASLSFYAYNAYQQVDGVREFYQSIHDLREEIQWLKYNNDKGAFTSSTIQVPADYAVSFAYSAITIKNSTDSLSIPIEVNFTTPHYLTQGMYTLRLCYGDCDKRNYLIEFE